MAYQKKYFTFYELYDLYSSALFGEIFRIVKSEQAACDVLKKTFLEIYKNADNYNPGKIKVFTWMFAIARNNALDYVSDVRPVLSISKVHFSMVGSSFYHPIHLS